MSEAISIPALFDSRIVTALPVAAGAEEDEEGEEQECCHGCQTSPQDDVDLPTA